MVNSVVAGVQSRDHDRNHLALHTAQGSRTVHQLSIQFVMVLHGVAVDPVYSDDVVGVRDTIDFRNLFIGYEIDECHKLFKLQSSECSRILGQDAVLSASWSPYHYYVRRLNASRNRMTVSKHPVETLRGLNTPRPNRLDRLPSTLEYVRSGRSDTYQGIAAPGFG